MLPILEIEHMTLFRLKYMKEARNISWHQEKESRCVAIFRHGNIDDLAWVAFKASRNDRMYQLYASDDEFETVSKSDGSIYSGHKCYELVKE